MRTREDIIASLESMHARSEPDVVEAEIVAVEPEARSLENPNIPVTGAQLAALLNGVSTRAGIQVNEQNALTFIAVFAAIRILAEGVGMLPLITYRGDPTGGVRRKAVDNPIYWLLAYEPNPEMTAAVFKETLQAHLGGWGNAYARIQFDNAGRPVALYPLLPDRTRAERKAGQLVYRSETSTFAPEEIIHIPGLGFDGLRGYSPIGVAREAIGLGKAAEMFGSGFFGNGAHVGGILSIPGKMSGEQRVANAAAWNAAQSGLNNVGRTAMIDGGAKYEKIGIDPNDAQFLETRKFQVTEIARLYRVPPHMMADLEKATFSNIEQQSLDFLIYSLTPWLEKWEQEFNRKLFGRQAEFFASFDERRLLRADNAARQSYYASARQWGYMTVNEIRAEENMNPIGPQGDVYLQPVNMQRADQPQQTPTPAADETKPRPTAPTTRAAHLMLDVVVDAVTRMARKEANALGRAGDNAEKVERFYAEHRKHVAEALRPAAGSIAALCNADAVATARAIATVDEYAARRCDRPVEERDLAAESAALADAIESSIYRSN